MTDNEIIEALGQCETQKTCCDCPYFEKIGCKKHLYQEALDLINRQKAEIERLNAEAKLLTTDKGNLITDKYDLTTELTSAKAEIERLNDLLRRHQRHTDRIRMITAETAKKIKAEAVKECIKKAKSELKNISNFDFHGTLYYMVGEAFFDNLLKEMGV